MPYYGSRPFGDIFISPTSAVDNISARLYAEHKQREAKQAQDLQNLDNMFAKNVAGVRDEDVPVISDKYSTYKQAKIGLYKNPNLKNTERIAQEMDAQRKLGDNFTSINDSKQTKKQLEDNAKIVASKPNDFIENAATILAMTNGLTSEQLKKGLTIDDPNGEIDPVTKKVKKVTFNPLDIESLRDRGNVQDWLPIINKAVGTVKDVGTIEEDKKGTDGILLGKEITPIKAGNSPATYYTNLASAMAGTGRLRHFNNTFKDAYGEQEANNIIEGYQKLQQDPIAVKAWGEEGLNIPPTALLNPTTRTLALNSMAYALTHKPVLGKPTNLNDLSGKREANMADKKAMEALKDANIKGRMYLRKSLGLDMPTVDNGVSFDEFGGDKDVEFEVKGTGSGIISSLTGGTFGKQQKGKIIKGIVYNGDGTPMKTGEIIVNGADVPANVVSSGRAAKMIGKYMPDKVTLVVKDGEIQSLSGDQIQPISRRAIWNAQREVDKEPVKSPKKKFGNTDAPKKEGKKAILD